MKIQDSNKSFKNSEEIKDQFLSTSSLLSTSHLKNALFSEPTLDDIQFESNFELSLIGKKTISEPEDLSSKSVRFLKQTKEVDQMTEQEIKNLIDLKKWNT